MHHNAPAYFTLNFTETRVNGNETVIAVYLSDPPIVIRPKGKEKTEMEKEARKQVKRAVWRLETAKRTGFPVNNETCKYTFLMKLTKMISKVNI